MEKLKKIIIIMFLISMLLFTNSFAENKGWIEMQCEVPKDFKYSAIHYSFADDKDNFYEGKLYKENNFVGRLKLPYGTYYLNDSFVVNDNKYDYIINWVPGEWEVKNQEKATLIKLAVIHEPLEIDIKEIVTPSGQDDSDIKNSDQEKNNQEEVPYKNRDGELIGNDVVSLEDSKKDKGEINYIAAAIVGLIIVTLSYIILKKNRRN